MGEAALKLTSTEASTDLVLIRSTPARVEFNIDELRANVRLALEPYDVVVTADTVKDAKNLMADLNKKAKSIKDVFKEAAAKVTAPVSEAEAQIFQLADEITQAREKLKSQVEVFETERKEEGRKALLDKQAALWELEGVEEEFRRSDASKLVSLSCLTAKGSLTAGTLTKLKDLVAADKALQNQTQNRLLVLENESLKSGLRVPLTRAHVEAFLFEHDSVYVARLAAMLAQEVKRQEASEAAARAKIEEDAKRATAKAQAESSARAADPIQSLQSEIDSAKQRLPYADRHYIEEERHIRDMEFQLSEMKKAATNPPMETDPFILCPIDNIGLVLGKGTIDDSDTSKPIKQALAVSRENSVLVAVWSKKFRRIAIVDGSSGEVYQRVNAQ